MATSERFVCDRVAGIRLRALHWGNPTAPPLILLHGGGANARWWDHIAESFSRDFHVVALDFRGHGDSDHTEEVRVGAFDDDLDSLIEHLGARQPILVGHSMGGHVALDRASRHPETRALVLLDILGGATPRDKRVARLALSLRRTYRSREEAIARFRFFPPAPGAKASLRRAIGAASVREEEDGRWGFAFDPRWFGLPARKRPELSSIVCPTLLVRGAQSELLTPDHAQAMVATLPKGQFCEIPDAGHHVQIEQPQAVVRAIQDFLAPLA